VTSLQTTRVRCRRGFTLVELMIVVAIIGVLAALAIYGVRKYLSLSKSAEARQNVGAIARSAVAAYTRVSAPGELMASGASAKAEQHKLCTTSHAVPATFALIQGRKYQPSTKTAWSDFNWGSRTRRCRSPLPRTAAREDGSATRVAPSAPPVYQTCAIAAATSKVHLAANSANTGQ
jgi:prepilin-type N-terminal cleavage/methylation domain-containing protein